MRQQNKLTVRLMIGKSVNGFDSPPSLEKWKEFATAIDVIATTEKNINVNLEIGFCFFFQQI